MSNPFERPAQERGSESAKVPEEDTDKIEEVVSGEEEALRLAEAHGVFNFDAEELARMRREGMTDEQIEGTIVRRREEAIKAAEELLEKLRQERDKEQLAA